MFDAVKYLARGQRTRRIGFAHVLILKPVLSRLHRLPLAEANGINNRAIAMFFKYVRK